MPTGYTHEIEKGITFEDFTMNCARAFGALISMRDAPSDAKIPKKFEPSDHHIKGLRKAEKEISRFHKLSEAKLTALRDKEFKENFESWMKRSREKVALKKKYEEMLDKVKKWTPPTSDHNGLKKFMIEQIEMSIDSDCSTKYDKIPLKPKLEDWKKETMDSLKWDLEYHEKELKEEKLRCEDRTDWVQKLIKSLK